MSAAPASTKVRKTKVAMDWFYDQHRKSWRFLPTDLSHQASYDRIDPVTRQPIQPARTHEMKGWVPAALAIQNIPESHKSMPDVLRERYASLLPDGKKGEAA